MASKRARLKGDLERRIQRAIRAHCKSCDKDCAGNAGDGKVCS
jgi:hypothetical protein